MSPRPAQQWEKLGRIFVPSGTPAWMSTHAAVPFVEPLGGDHYRVYCSCRDAQGRARVGCVTIELTNAPRVVAVDPEPVLDIGPLGSYEDSGVIGSWLLQDGQTRYLYYCGVTRGVTVPLYFYSGLAVDESNGGTFRKVSAAPLLERNSVDPFLTGQLCVLKEGNRWRMWYVSGQRWDDTPAGPRHYYHIKYAESDDGRRWRRDGRVCIDFEEGHYAIGRPCVLRDGDGYRMWYCYRGSSYRIGYAESDDGLTWRRLDGQVGIDISPSGWDSGMVAYPFVFRHKETMFMLYNGNDYGKTGFGLARLL